MTSSPHLVAPLLYRAITHFTDLDAYASTAPFPHAAVFARVDADDDVRERLEATRHAVIDTVTEDDALGFLLLGEDGVPRWVTVEVPEGLALTAGELDGWLARNPTAYVGVQSWVPGRPLTRCDDGTLAALLTGMVDEIEPVRIRIDDLRAGGDLPGAQRLEHQHFLRATAAGRALAERAAADRTARRLALGTVAVDDVSPHLSAGFGVTSFGSDAVSSTAEAVPGADASAVPPAVTSSGLAYVLDRLCGVEPVHHDREDASRTFRETYGFEITPAELAEPALLELVVGQIATWDMSHLIERAAAHAPDAVATLMAIDVGPAVSPTTDDAVGGGSHLLGTLAHGWYVARAQRLVRQSRQQGHWRPVSASLLRAMPLTSATTPALPASVSADAAMDDDAATHGEDLAVGVVTPLLSVLEEHPLGAALDVAGPPVEAAATSEHGGALTDGGDGAVDTPPHGDDWLGGGDDDGGRGTEPWSDAPVASAAVARPELATSADPVPPRPATGVSCLLGAVHPDPERRMGTRGLAAWYGVTISDDDATVSTGGLLAVARRVAAIDAVRLVSRAAKGDATVQPVLAAILSADLAVAVLVPEGLRSAQDAAVWGAYVSAVRPVVATGLRALGTVSMTGLQSALARLPDDATLEQLDVVHAHLRAVMPTPATVTSPLPTDGPPSPALAPSAAPAGVAASLGDRLRTTMTEAAALLTVVSPARALAFLTSTRRPRATPEDQAQRALQRKIARRLKKRFG
jgi:hypothetical protein